MFEDGDWNVLMDFPNVTGWPSEMMHLLDGGALIEFLNYWYFMGYDTSVVSEQLEETMAWMNKFTFLEQARSLRSVFLFSLSIEIAEYFKFRPLIFFYSTNS
jgi:hypothetical protein